MNCLNAAASPLQIFTWQARERRYRPACSELILDRSMLSCPSQWLKHAASRTCLCREYNAYPSPRTHCANPEMCADNGPPSGRERTTSSLIMHLIAQLPSFDLGGSNGARL